MARKTHDRYIVTGPGIEDGEEPSYADPGPALSCSISKTVVFGADDPDVTFYVRDAITDEIIGHTEKVGAAYMIHRR